MALENAVPLRYLLDNETHLLLLRGEFETNEELKASGLLSEGAQALPSRLLDVFVSDLVPHREHELVDEVVRPMLSAR